MFFITKYYIINLNSKNSFSAKECFPMSVAVKKKQGKFTYKDYLSWPDDERWELIDGIAYNMTPAPSRIHQKILGELYRQIANYLTDKQCEVYFAPFDVRLPSGKEKNDDEITTVVQPDITVVCDISKLDEKGCKGSPDWVIEILSPATAKKDLKEKYFLYEKFAVKEYWIVYPDYKVVSVYVLNENKSYNIPVVYGEEDEIKVGIFEDLTIDLKTVFA